MFLCFQLLGLFWLSGAFYVSQNKKEISENKLCLRTTQYILRQELGIKLTSCKIGLQHS